MYSRNFLQLIYQLTKIARAFGAFPLKFDNIQAYFLPDAKAIKRQNRNYFLTVCWVFAAVWIIAKRYYESDLESLIITICFWICGILLLTIYSIGRWFSRDLTQYLNGTLALLRFLRGKLAIIMHFVFQYFFTCLINVKS